MRERGQSREGSIAGKYVSYITQGLESDVGYRENLLMERERELLIAKQQITERESEVTTLKARLDKLKADLQEKDKLVAEWKVTNERTRDQMRAEKEGIHSEWKSEMEVFICIYHLI